MECEGESEVRALHRGRGEEVECGHKLSTPSASPGRKGIGGRGNRFARIETGKRSHSGKVVPQLHAKVRARETTQFGGDHSELAQLQAHRGGCGNTAQQARDGFIELVHDHARHGGSLYSCADSPRHGIAAA